jgi:hypothetical protein
MSSDFELKLEFGILTPETRASFLEIVSESAGDVVDEEAALLWLEEIGRRQESPKPVDQVMREARAAFARKTSRR